MLEEDHPVLIEPNTWLEKQRNANDAFYKGGSLQPPELLIRLYLNSQYGCSFFAGLILYCWKVSSTVYCFSLFNSKIALWNATWAWLCVQTPSLPHFKLLFQLERILWSWSIVILILILYHEKQLDWNRCAWCWRANPVFCATLQGSGVAEGLKFLTPEEEKRLSSSQVIRTWRSGSSPPPALKWALSFFFTVSWGPGAREPKQWTKLGRREQKPLSPVRKLGCISSWCDCMIMT